MSNVITCPAGSTFSFSTTDGSGYIAIATEITKIAMEGRKTEHYDATNFGSHFPDAEEKQGWATPGDASCECNLTPADFIEAKSLEAVHGFFLVQFPQGQGSSAVVLEGQFPGYIETVSGDVPVKGTAKMTIKIHMTGKDYWSASGTSAA